MEIILPFAIFHLPFSTCYNPGGMKYFYGEFDGEEFPTPDKLFSFDR